MQIERHLIWCWNVGRGKRCCHRRAKVVWFSGKAEDGRHGFVSSGCWGAGGVGTVLVRRNAMTGSSEGEVESSGAAVLETRLESALRLVMVIGSGGVGEVRVGGAAVGGGGITGPVATSSACRSIWTVDGAAAAATGLNGVKNQFLASELKPVPFLRRLCTVEVERMDSCEGEMLRRRGGLDRIGVAGVVSIVGKFGGGNGSGECPLKVGTISIRTRLPVAEGRLVFCFRTFLNGSIGIGWGGQSYLVLSSSNSFRLLWLDSMSMAVAVNGVVTSMLPGL